MKTMGQTSIDEIADEMAKRIKVYTRELADYLTLIEERLEKKIEEDIAVEELPLYIPDGLEIHQIIGSCVMGLSQNLNSITYDEWLSIAEEYRGMKKESSDYEGDLTTHVDFDERMQNACGRIADFVRDNDLNVPYVKSGENPSYRICASLAILAYGRKLKDAGNVTRDAT